MYRVRILSVGVVLVEFFTTACFAGAPNQPRGKRVSDRLDPGPVHTVVYSVRDLPVWSNFPKKEQERFDPSLLITHIQSVVAPESWNTFSAQIRPYPKDATLVITQSRENHLQISELLGKLHDQADSRVTAWVAQQKSHPETSTTSPAK